MKSLLNQFSLLTFLRETLWFSGRTNSRKRRKLVSHIDELEIRRLLAADLDDQMSEVGSFGRISSEIILSSAISYKKDVNMYGFDVFDGQRLAFDIETHVTHKKGLDSYIRLFTPDGTVLAVNRDGVNPGEGAGVDSYLEYTFPIAGRYYLGVSSYGNINYNPYSGTDDRNGRTTGQYDLTIRNVGIAFDGRKNLYLNFDGVSIFPSDLQRWAGTDWSQGWMSNLDPEGNGIVVSPFLSNQTVADRYAIIAGIMQNVQVDLAPFGIIVHRITGLAVENQYATTVFLGNSRLANSHVACDIDYFNNNKTDIAFVGDEVWPSVTDTILALSDVVLHEAGHTFGLFHVNVVQNGLVYNESMGLRYSTPQSDWARDTSFLNRTFAEYLDHGGGRGFQNSYATMIQNFSGPIMSNLNIEQDPALLDRIRNELAECYLSFDEAYSHHSLDESVSEPRGVVLESKPIIFQAFLNLAFDLGEDSFDLGDLTPRMPADRDQTYAAQAERLEPIIGTERTESRDPLAISSQLKHHAVSIQHHKILEASSDIERDLDTIFADTFMLTDVI